jgi:hypothetical protein
VAGNRRGSSSWKIKTADLVARLIEMEGKLGPSGRTGDPLRHSMAEHLAPFGVKARKHRLGESTFQGYDLAEIREAFAGIARHSPSQSGTPEQVLDYSACLGGRVNSVTAVPGTEPT